MARIESLNVVFEEIDDIGGSVGRTAIDKRPVADTRTVTTDGVAGDFRSDMENHGSDRQAIYAYAVEDYQWWSQHAGVEFGAGRFGDNLTTSGIDLTSAIVGTTVRIGTATLQITDPRIPCGTFQRWLAQEQWVKRFTEEGRSGTYLAVVTSGDVTSGDDIEILDVPSHGVTVLDSFRVYTGDRDHDRLVRVEACADVEMATREKARKALSL